MVPSLTQRAQFFRYSTEFSNLLKILERTNLLRWYTSCKNNNRCRVTSTTKGKREFVHCITKCLLLLSLTVHYFYIKISSFTQVLSIRIVFSRFYRLISYSLFAYSNSYLTENSRWVSLLNLTFAVINVTPNLSNRESLPILWSFHIAQRIFPSIFIVYAITISCKNPR